MISGFLKSEIFLMAVATINIILLILYICNCVKLKKINKNENTPINNCLILIMKKCFY